MVYSISFVMPYEQWPSAEFLDGDLAEIDLAGPNTEEKEFLKLVHKHLLFLLGLEIELKNPPKTWHWNSSKPLLDCDKARGFPLIPERFKSIVEELEPGVHQFFPVEVVDKSKQPIAVRWLWNVCNRIDSMDRERTTYLQKHGQHWAHPKRFSDDELPEDYDRSVKPKYFVSNKRVGAAHFWRDPNIVANPIFCSEAAGDALGSEKFSGFGLLAWESV